MTDNLTLRLATAEDIDRIWEVIEPAMTGGETFALPSDWSREAAMGFWLGMEKRTYVAERDGVVLGSYYLRTNQLGPGSHVCNCGYVTAAEARGTGVASAMCLHSLDEARKQGFEAMQYNCVVSTNEQAIRLWQKHGFEIVGRLPRAFAHPTAGKVDALVMYQLL